MYMIMIGIFCAFVVAAAVHKSTQDYESLNGYELYQLDTAHTVTCRLHSNVHIQKSQAPSFYLTQSHSPSLAPQQQNEVSSLLNFDVDTIYSAVHF